MSSAAPSAPFGRGCFFPQSKWGCFFPQKKHWRFGRGATKRFGRDGWHQLPKRPPPILPESGPGEREIALIWSKIEVRSAQKLTCKLRRLQETSEILRNMRGRPFESRQDPQVGGEVQQKRGGGRREEDVNNTLPTSTSTFLIQKRRRAQWQAISLDIARHWARCHLFFGNHPQK